MTRILTVFLMSLLCAPGLQAESLQVQGHTVDVFVSGHANSRTVVYVPGCNGKDAIGRLYQSFHLEKIRAVFQGDVNVVMVQVFDDITHGAKDGVCFMDVKKQNELGTYSPTLARQVASVFPWLKAQPWFNGTAHFFGFSQGGRVGLFANSLRSTQGFFKSFNLVWPMCLKPYAPPERMKAHTPTRIYATENDPISQPKNCPDFYTEDSPIALHLFPGDVHSWATHPSIMEHTEYWPNYDRKVTHRYVPAFADGMWMTWAEWARCLESGAACS